MSQTETGGGSFRDIYEEYLPMVYRLAFTYMRNKGDSEDAAHETFLRLLKNKKPFSDREHVKAWLLVTVSNVCRDMLRRSCRRDVSLQEGALSPTEDGEKRLLLQAVLELPDSYKTVVYLYYYEGYSVAEIGKILGKPAGTVKTWLSRARKQLRETLGGDQNDGYEIG